MSRLATHTVTRRSRSGWHELRAFTVRPRWIDLAVALLRGGAGLKPSGEAPDPGAHRRPSPSGRAPVEADPAAFASSVVHASGAPLLLLDHDLRVIAASAGYRSTFHDSAPEGKRLWEITGGAWMEPHVQDLLDHVRNGEACGAIDTQVTCPEGQRQVRVRIESAPPDARGAGALVVTIDDLTGALAQSAAQAAQLQELAALLHETQHRTANNLAIICSILNMKARAIVSEETRTELEGTRSRVLAMAAIERHLQYSDPHVPTPVAPFLQALCRQLRTSLIAEGREIQLSVRAAPGSQPRRTAVILGLTVTELIINALKHAFPGDRPGEILVEYEEIGSGWFAAVSDNGAGLDPAEPGKGDGLGFGIVTALAAQLKAQIRVDSTSGLRVELRRDADASAKEGR
jgi:chemotaxis protein methyltransferase CheR